MATYHGKLCDPHDVLRRCTDLGLAIVGRSIQSRERTGRVWTLVSECTADKVGSKVLVRARYVQILKIALDLFCLVY